MGSCREKHGWNMASKPHLPEADWVISGFVLTYSGWLLIKCTDLYSHESVIARLAFMKILDLEKVEGIQEKPILTGILHVGA